MLSTAQEARHDRGGPACNCYTCEGRETGTQEFKLQAHHLQSAALHVVDLCSKEYA
jgi:hypothetical protein